MQVFGGIAQLGERLNGIQEVAGSIPTISRKEKTVLSTDGAVFSFVFILKTKYSCDIILIYPSEKVRKKMANLCPNCKAGYNASSCKCTSCGAYIISSDANSFDVPREVIEGIKNSYDRSGFPGVFVHNTRLGAGEFPLRLGVSKYYWTGVTGTAGKLLLTDKKLYFSAHRFTYYRPNETFDLSDIEKVEYDSNLLLSHQISVYVRGERHKFVVYRGKEWVDLINTAKKHFAPAAPAEGKVCPPPPSAPASKAATSPKAEPVAPAVPASDANPCGGQPKYVEELRQLKRLWDDGIITKEEFEAKKKQILNL